jgi:hypothetical protein
LPVTPVRTVAVEEFKRRKNFPEGVSKRIVAVVALILRGSPFSEPIVEARALGAAIWPGESRAVCKNSFETSL